MVSTGLTERKISVILSQRYIIVIDAQPGKVCHVLYNGCEVVPLQRFI
jgi:hypothetical protein